MPNTINKENAVKECSRALCNDAQETLRSESNAAAQDTYVACGCNTLARDLGKVAVAGGSLAGAFLLAKSIWPGGNRGSTIGNDAEAAQLIEAVDLAVKEGDLKGALVKLDQLLATKGQPIDKKPLEKRRRRIFGAISMLELTEKDIEKARQNNNPVKLLLALEQKADLYEAAGYSKGAFKVWEEVAVKYRQQEEWYDFIKTSLKLNELVDKVFDKEIERARYRVGLWTDIARSYQSLGEDSKAVVARAKAGQEVAKMEAVEKLAAPAPVKTAPDTGWLEVEDYIAMISQRVNGWHDTAQKLIDGGSPKELDAASKIYEKAAHLAEGLGEFDSAAKEYGKAAQVLNMKSALTAADQARLAELHEAATDALRSSGAETPVGVARSAGVEGTARVARSVGAESREEMERRSEGPERQEGQKEGRKGPEVRRK